MTTPQIRSAAREVLDFWFGELTPERHFTRDPALDEEIRRRFGALREEVFATDAAGWQDDRDCLLAAVIVLDQFSRNLFRDRAEAFAADPLALDLCLTAIAAGYHADLEPVRRAFFYMPLMHCEDRGVQLFSVRCFSDPGLEFNLKFARAHAAVIERFGRYPSRNATLGRISTPEELEYLAQPGSGW
ncbi:MAG: DUF924 domain-containing protein [Sphingomonadales bacterium]|nr:MAG: DUF924 domain-containing protein [Sphingomonadales bacterium]TNF04418.1 MAG: DUF924 domain-containing protein [Sphingomonadales bacterium]